MEKIRRERNYSWMDIITICEEKLPDYEEKARSSEFPGSSRARDGGAAFSTGAQIVCFL